MNRKRSPIFHKVSNLVRISIFIPKLRKPIIPKILFLKKFRKRKEFKLLRHYNYGFPGEYQFSPSSTPLIQFQRRQLKKKSYPDFNSLLFLCRCLGNLRAEAGGSVGEYQHEALTLPVSAIDDGFLADDLFEPFDSVVEDDSIDQRAESFIERFYQEMRMQRQQSI